MWFIEFTRNLSFTTSGLNLLHTFLPVVLISVLVQGQSDVCVCNPEDADTGTVKSNLSVLLRLHGSLSAGVDFFLEEQGKKRTSISTVITRTPQIFELKQNYFDSAKLVESSEKSPFYVQQNWLQGGVKDV